ncbi:bifunctional folylpolyglutamate synthase/dihydrofolate synthase [Woodsholea maritima]|uniref:bifunctional folylpolyglutamate synthase/dihydrofolate synthase n=1 Tax=Woodsholea maritima TaxID=240237 RepID=UPI00037BD814|nr:folylpolyglutamate synthase/dihydrofolate synthase family protein [Woodsholea maritima]
MTSAPETIEDALARLARYHPKKIDLSLERIERLLAALGDPHKRLPPVIHVAGTNGKGSTVAFLKAMCEAAGERVHVYTSPHLVRFNERIVLGGDMVDDARLREAFARCEAANGDNPITFFEITTAAAFLLFSETPADRVILEVGLGGIVDATNVIEAPAVCVITPVSLDHQDFLGDDITQIAREKAGILKRGVRAIIAPQAPEAQHMIEAVANVVGAPLSVADRDFFAHREHDRLVFEEDSALLDLPLPALIGAHQITNAASAIAAARYLQLPDQAISQGLKTVSWPARLQRLTQGDLAELVQDLGGDLWLDGGHNEAAGHALSSALGELEEREERPLVLVSAFSKNKDSEAYFRYFVGMAAKVITTTFQGGRDGAASAHDTAEAARRAGLPAQTSADLISALHDACDDDLAPRVVICGSLYLAGQVLALNAGAGESVQSSVG